MVDGDRPGQRRVGGDPRSAGPKVSRVTTAATRPISAYRLNSSAGPTQPKLTNSSVVTNGVNPDTIAEIW